MSHNILRILLSAIASFAILHCYAQSSTDITNIQPHQHSDTIIYSPITPLYNSPAPSFTPTRQDSTHLIYIANTHSLLQRNMLGVKNLELYTFATQNDYIGLMNTHSAQLSMAYHYHNLSLQAGIGATRYQSWNTTTQVGINASLVYNFSNQWSAGVFAQLYNTNPYFSMAAYPYVNTSSYGGWMSYEGEKLGLQLGARRYYDPYQRQWRVEPIVIPSLKLGKHVKVKVNVGALVGRAIETILR